MSLPISIILYSLRAKKVNQLKLFLYLKHISSGQVILSLELQGEVCKALKWRDRRTFSTNLQWLLQHHWVTINTKRQLLRLVSFQQLHKIVRGRIFTGSKMGAEDFNTFRPFLYASVICWAVFAKRKHKTMLERKEGHSAKSIACSLQSDMPNRYLAKIIGNDQSTVSRYKQAAQKARYIFITEQSQNLHLSIKHIPMIQKYAPEDVRHSIFLKNNNIYIRKSDLISSRIQLIYLRHLRVPQKVQQL